MSLFRRFEGVVDSHAHVVRRDAPMTTTRHQPLKNDATVDQYLSVLDSQGIKYGLLTAPSIYLDDNSLLLAALRQHPERLRGTATLFPGAEREQIAELARAGVVGIRYNWIGHAELPDLDAPEWQKLFAHFRDFDLHIEYQIEGSRLPPVVAAAEKQGLKVVIDHFGRPDPRSGCDCIGFKEVCRLLRTGKGWVKFSAPYRLEGANPDAYAKGYLDAGGSKQVVWGSDWPWNAFENEVTFDALTRDLERWLPDDASRRDVLVETPSRLFGFTATANGADRR